MGDKVCEEAGDEFLIARSAQRGRGMCLSLQVRQTGYSAEKRTGGGGISQISRGIPTGFRGDVGVGDLGKKTAKPEGAERKEMQPNHVRGW